MPESPDWVRAALLKKFGPLDGGRVNGGCDSCDAYQTTAPVESGGWIITVHHDDWCRELKKHQTGKL